MTTSQAPIMTGPSRPGLGLALLRVVVAVLFIAHGYQKIFQFGFAGVTQGFTQMGIPMPGLVGPAIAILEFVGGIALLLGLFSRYVAILLACDMAGAILFVHGKNGLFLPTGMEFALLLGISCVALALAGPGEASIDGMMGRRRS